MNSNKTIIITTSPQIVTLTTFFTELGRQFIKQGYLVVIIFDNNKVRKEKERGLIYKTWPSRRPTKIQDFIFLQKLIREYKPSHIISSFGAVNVSIIGGFLKGIPNRIAWSHTKHHQILKDSSNKTLSKILLFRKRFILKLFATEMHTNSYSTARDIEKYLNFSKNKIKVITFLIGNIKLENVANKKK